MPKSKLLKTWLRWRTDYEPWKTGSGHMTQEPLSYQLGLLVLGNHQPPTSRNAILLYLLVLSQTILTLYLHTNESDSNIAKESKSHLAILLRLALALRSRETRKGTLREYLKETLVYTRLGVRRSLRL